MRWPVIRVTVEGQPIDVVPVSAFTSDPVPLPVRTYQMVSHKSVIMTVPTNTIRHIISIKVNTIPDATDEPERIVSVVYSGTGTIPLWQGSGQWVPPNTIVPLWQEIWFPGAPETLGRYNPYAVWAASHWLPDMDLRSGEQLLIYLQAGGTIDTWITYFDTTAIV